MTPQRFLDTWKQALLGSGDLSAVETAALRQCALWLSDEEAVEDLPQMMAMLRAGKSADLVDAFYQQIPFGTGGRRGPVGIGPNRINVKTICSSVQGHSQYLRKRFPGRELSVVIAYDVRVFEDARAVYESNLPLRLRGMSSRDFAELAAGVYAANDVQVHMLSRGSERWLSTPELSFAIRFLEAQGGLNVSASHNPPDDNGAKVYNHHGGQEIPPFDQQLVEEVEKAGSIQRLAYEEGVASGLIRGLPEDLHEAYIALNLSLLSTDCRSARVVFTPLHGTADSTVGDVLREAGFDVALEPAQSIPDGRFPTVPYGAPNPEVSESMDRAVSLAERTGADLVFSCDPDADRLGVVVKTASGWRPLTGNEIALLATCAALQGPRVSTQSVVMRTEVTCSLVSRLAKAHGVLVVDHLLVGFKYIGDGIRALEEEGVFAGTHGGPDDFLVGVEESHGLLVTPGVRDKDAAGGALLLAELASLEKQKGRTLVDVLEGIWVEHGRVSNVLLSLVMRGAKGRQQIEAIQSSLRSSPPALIAGRRCVRTTDHQDPEGVHGAIRSETDRASRNVLSFELEGGARVIVRPSGTEPKSKVYAELYANNGESQQDVEERCRSLARDFVRELLVRVDIHLPAWTQDMSGLLAIEDRLDFAERVLPELLDRLGDPEIEVWLDAEMAHYGRDARRLVASGVRTWVAERSGDFEGLLALFRV